jgi:transcriptional regulator with XRE-family HTH domain
MDFYPIPNNLKSYRKQAELRQLDVADKLGFKSAERISKWEHGDAIPNIVNLFKLAGLYKTTVEELYGKFIEEIRKK